ncbi:restriction endonuclease subunit S [Helicobacter didelphidarum]|uniref:Restriction endonuclease subunit S n=1 Tax=Helicobacter didelphidarum TaxID=2040648 RepID=A0A3D8IJS6_9HELI|nr:restriction endonuclease subunit S [Helicobacter didelphidarum]RDU65280.1 restriction endonuclease subunit S [Helicobacter didelphidarum]
MVEGERRGEKIFCDKKDDNTESPLCHCEERSDEAIHNTNNINNMDCYADKSARNDELNNAFTPPFEIPPTWAWVRLGDIGEWKAGSTPSRTNPKYYTNGTILWLKTGDLNNDVVYETEEKITEEAFKSSSMILHSINSILIAMYGATIGKVGIVGEEMATNQACCGCDTNNTIYYKFLFYYLQAINDWFVSQSFGSGQPNISKEKILDTLIPLPPLEEQKFIAKELENLFTLTKGLRVE